MENNTVVLKTAMTQAHPTLDAALHGAKRAVGNTVDSAKDIVNSGIQSGQWAFSRATDAVSAGAQTAHLKVGQSIDMAKVAATNAASSAVGAASYVGHRAEAVTGSIGGALEDTGHYLKNDGLRHISADVTGMIRRNPLPAILIGIGAGFLMGVACMRRNA
jgi:hypothetical protein